jgi:hypothetical protein
MQACPDAVGPGLRFGWDREISELFAAVCHFIDVQRLG